jgi:enterochelin esterase-like enzyme
VIRRFLGSCAAAAIAVAWQGGPVVREAEVTFVAAGTPADPPRIVADFNGWDGGAMTPSADGRTYTLRVTLDPAARIEYLVAYKDRFVLDPGNPRSVPAPAGPPRSELRMPQYRPPTPFRPPARRGSVETIQFRSRKGDERRLRVYVPADGARGAQVLYVHDGDIVLDRLGLPEILDSLIDSHDIAPAVVVFIDAVDRHDDYEPASPLRDVLTSEIVPLIEQRYQTLRTRRAVMGLSRSAVGALDACANGGIRVDACALVAPAIAPTYVAGVLPPADSTMRVVIAAGTYDLPLGDEARALRDALRQRRVPVEYSESPDGHNHTAFRARLPWVLRAVLAP